MRTICDVCESAAAILFCAADEAALCQSCDVKVHMCNKLANRHVRVGLEDPSDVQRCDICENAPAFFYCEIDGSSLCLQCDMVVHVGGKRKHERFLLLRQRIEFPGDKSGSCDDLGLQTAAPAETRKEPNNQSKLTRTRTPPFQDNNGGGRMNTKLIDLNAKPQRIHEQTSHDQGMDVVNGSNHESPSVVPIGSFKREP